jgi:hypothetical protein
MLARSNLAVSTYVLPRGATSKIALLTAMAGVAACGGQHQSAGNGGTTSQAPAVGSYESGTRLRAHLWQGDGAAMFVDWHDTQLGIDCSFQDMGAGDLRCVPQKSTGEAASQPAVYLDSSCTQLGSLAGTKPSGFVVAPPGQDACGLPLGSLQIGVFESAAVSVAQVFSMQGGSCLRTDEPPGQLAWPLAPVGPSAFVGAHIVTEPRGATLDIEILLAADGTKQLGHAIDRRQSAPCSGRSDWAPPLFVDDPLERCLPLGIVTASPVGYFGTADCNPQLNGLWGCYEDMCPPPTEGVLTEMGACDGGACETLVGILIAGPRLDTTWQLDPNGTCVQVPIGGSCFFHPASSLIPPDQIPKFATRRVGDGRLSQILRTAEDDEREIAEESFTLWDNAQTGPCSLASFSDGKSRCLPGGTADIGEGGFLFYADPACTQLVVPVSSGTPPPFAKLVSGATDVVIVVSAPVDKIYRVGDPFTGPVFSTLTGTCAPSSATGPYYSLGPEVDPTLFAELTETVE